MRARLPNGRLHALVNNAGISPKGPDGARLGVLATDAATWMHVLNVNLVSIALLVRALIDGLAAAKASIVNVASIAGSRVHPFAGVAYAASKAGLAALTRELANELAPRGIRTNAIAPGEIDTAILSPGTDELVHRDVPMGRLGDRPRGRGDDPFPVQRRVVLYQRRGDLRRRRPACLTCAGKKLRRGDPSPEESEGSSARTALT